MVFQPWSMIVALVLIVIVAGTVLLVIGTFRKPERTRAQMSAGIYPDAAGAPACAAPAPSLSGRLTELDDLLRDGRITADEHAAARARLLGTL